jgi:hypothetical protein
LSLVFACNYASLVPHLRRDALQAQVLADQAHALATEHGFGRHELFGSIMRGWCLARQGHHAQGLALLRQSLAG